MAKKVDQQQTENGLESKVFTSEVNADAIAMYIRVYRANQRQGTQSTKTRGEVSGGGKKPWKQKGTGRARQGSTRASQWVHGGIAHGPKPRDWSLDLPVKMKRAALASALSQKAADGLVTVVEPITMKAASTKEFLKHIGKLNLPGASLVIVPSYDETVLKSARNIENIALFSADDVNVYDIMKAKNLIVVNEAVVKLEERI